MKKSQFFTRFDRKINFLQYPRRQTDVLCIRQQFVLNKEHITKDENYPGHTGTIK